MAGAFPDPKQAEQVRMWQGLHKGHPSKELGAVLRALKTAGLNKQEQAGGHTAMDLRLIDGLFPTLGDRSAYFKFRKKRGIAGWGGGQVLQARENPFPDRPERVDGGADFGGHARLLHIFLIFAIHDSPVIAIPRAFRKNASPWQESVG